MSNEYTPDVENSETETVSEERRSLCRMLMKFLASDLGLLIVTVAYSVGGAYLFIYLERYIELQNCQIASMLEDVSISDMSQSIYSYVISTTDNTSVIYDEIEVYLYNLTNDVYDRKDSYRYAGQDCESVTGWTFSSALLFTITVITSIGFGHITPVSWEGQITCICYAVIGIPLFLICLQRISEILSQIFRFMYSTIIKVMCCCYLAYLKRGRRKNQSINSKTPFNSSETDYSGTVSIDPTWPEAYNNSNNSAEHYDEIEEALYRIENRIPILVVMGVIAAYIYFGAYLCTVFEEWSMIISVYCCYVALSTLGFGDYVPGITSGSADGYRFMATSLYIVVGLAVLAMSFDLMAESIVEKLRWFSKRFRCVKKSADENDEERRRYAHFQYLKHTEINVKQDNKMDTFFDLPSSGFDYVSTDGQWLSNIKDKKEPKDKSSK